MFLTNNPCIHHPCLLLVFNFNTTFFQEAPSNANIEATSNCPHLFIKKYDFQNQKNYPNKNYNSKGKVSIYRGDVTVQYPSYNLEMYQIKYIYHRNQTFVLFWYKWYPLYEYAFQENSCYNYIWVLLFIYMKKIFSGQ